MGRHEEDQTIAIFSDEKSYLITSDTPVATKKIKTTKYLVYGITLWLVLQIGGFALDTTPNDEYAYFSSFGNDFGPYANSSNSTDEPKGLRYPPQRRPGRWIRATLDVAKIIGQIAISRWLFKKMMGLDPGVGGKAKKGYLTLDDVAGCDEVKQEVRELVTFLKNPTHFKAMGAKMPKGVLFVGPPGTGKTLTAKAIASEANVPFYYAAASEFIQMYVGLGALKVREIFKKAKRNSPALIFIDEIDAIGQSRNGMTGDTEARRTLTQLLSELDGFADDSGIIVLAATNTVEVLDAALLRPGRFDRIVRMPLPSQEGRLQLLELHAKGRPFANDIPWDRLARRTLGMSGADIQNLLNEAAMVAVRKGHSQITADDTEDALNRVQMGLERKGISMPEPTRALVAYHEAGHAVAGAFLPIKISIERITILPRGPSGGATWFVPDEDNSALVSREYMDNMLVMFLGGRVAEEMVFGKDKATIGASDDFQKATQMAQSMIMDYGFSDDFGPIGWAGSPVSEGMAGARDRTVIKIVNKAYERCKKLLSEHRAALDAVANELLEKETITGEEFLAILEGNCDKPKCEISGRTYDISGDAVTFEYEPVEVQGSSDDKNDEDKNDEGKTTSSELSFELGEVPTFTKKDSGP